MSKEQRKAITRSELVLEAWTELNSDSLGARELEEIQKTLAARYGANAIESPASIARSLADVGVRLRHPEVLDYDTVWRESQSLDSMTGQLDLTTIEAAVASLKVLHGVWERLKEQKDHRRLARLRTLVAGIRDQLRLASGSKTLSVQGRKVSVEVEQWLVVWLQNPQLFEDWLELRMNSSEFQTVFGK